MESFHEYIEEYKEQLEKGAIQEAYRGLMEYIMGLRTHFMKKYPDYVISGNIYYGYMDMTYFSVFPKSIKDRKLKVPIVFLHEAFRFEVWLAGNNKKVQAKYWKIIKKSNWKKYRTPLTTKGADSIIEYTLIEHPHFNELDKLTKQIEIKTLNFVEDVEDFLSKQPNINDN